MTPRSRSRPEGSDPHLRPRTEEEALFQLAEAVLDVVRRREARR